jgi:hypothetical protein
MLAFYTEKTTNYFTLTKARMKDKTMLTQCTYISSGAVAGGGGGGGGPGGHGPPYC